jgi:fatty acid desaturase
MSSPTPQGTVLSSPLPSSPEEPAFPEGSGEVTTHWVSRAAFSLIGAALLLSQVALGFAVYYQSWWLAALLVIPVSHFMHGALIGFHEASHGLLRKNRTLNEVDGVLAGMLSFMSFTLYRVAHQTHHSHLATERDVELWPFVKADCPRWARRLTAAIELNAGLLFTPFLFWRLFFVRNSIVRNRKVRRRIWGEFFLIIGFWSALIQAVNHWQVWPWFLWLFLVPGFIAGNLQSWRKYIEHVGLSGHTAKSATRSIVADTWPGRLLSLTLLHEPLHGVHHIKSGLPHTAYPSLTPLLKPQSEGDLPVFPNYRSAVKHLLKNLSDPKVGSHWPSGTDPSPS